MHHEKKKGSEKHREVGNLKTNQKRETSEEKESVDDNYVGLADVDFKKFLGCGG